MTSDFILHSLASSKGGDHKSTYVRVQGSGSHPQILLPQVAVAKGGKDTEIQNPETTDRVID